MTQSTTSMYDCTHGPKKNCAACLVGELVEVLTVVRGIVSMIDASPAGSLNADLKRQALEAISAALEKAKDEAYMIDIRDAPEVIEPPHRY